MLKYFLLIISLHSLQWIQIGMDCIREFGGLTYIFLCVGDTFSNFLILKIRHNVLTAIWKWTTLVFTIRNLFNAWQPFLLKKSPYRQSRSKGLHIRNKNNISFGYSILDITFLFYPILSLGTESLPLQSIYLWPYNIYSLCAIFSQIHKCVSP